MNRDHVLLEYMRECLDHIHELTAHGRDLVEGNPHYRAALIYYLQTLAESTQKLSPELQARYPHLDWVGIAGFRNRLVHGYLSINMAIIWKVVEADLPSLSAAVLDMLNHLT